MVLEVATFVVFAGVIGFMFSAPRHAPWFVLVVGLLLVGGGLNGTLTFPGFLGCVTAMSTAIYGARQDAITSEPASMDTSTHRVADQSSEGRGMVGTGSSRRLRQVPHVGSMKPINRSVNPGTHPNHNVESIDDFRV